MVRGFPQTCAWVYYEYQLDCDLQHMLQRQLAMNSIMFGCWLQSMTIPAMPPLLVLPGVSTQPCACLTLHFNGLYVTTTPQTIHVRMYNVWCAVLMCVSGACDLLTDVTMRLSPPPPVSSAGYEEEDRGHINKALHLL